MNKVQRKFIIDAIDQEHMLTDWESQFVNDLAERDEKNPDMVLSDKQNEILNRIQRKLD
jgi:hypothetical protein